MAKKELTTKSTKERTWKNDCIVFVAALGADKIAAGEIMAVKTTEWRVGPAFAKAMADKGEIHG